jgi:hypothetical protein
MAVYYLSDGLELIEYGIRVMRTLIGTSSQRHVDKEL